MADSVVRFSEQLQFGPFLLDARAGELRKHGIRIKLQERPFQILVALLEEPGSVVTRDELRRRLWPEGTFVDFDHGLSSAVNKLRAALSDSARHPRYIETVGRRGYRLIAEVKPATLASGAGGTQQPLPWQPAGAGNVVDLPSAGVTTLRHLVALLLRRWLSPPVVAAVLVLLAALVLYAITKPSPLPRVTRYEHAPVTDRADPWEELISDGTRVYFLVAEGTSWKLMQTSITGGEARPVAGPFPRTRILAVSPDRSHLLVSSFSAPDENLPLWTWPVQGGSPMPVGAVRADEATWSPAGDIVYTRAEQIRSVRPDGSGDRLLARVPGRAHFLRWSPDGRQLSYELFDVATNTQALWTMSADGSYTRLHFPSTANDEFQCCGMWTPDGRYFIYGVMRNGVTNLWAAREKTGWLRWRSTSPVRLTANLFHTYGPLLVDGNRLFAYIDSYASRTVKIGTDGRQTTLLPDVLHIALKFSRQYLVFQRREDWSLWRANLDGSDRVQLVAGDLRASHPEWSPDGAWVAFEGRSVGKPVRAYVVAARGGPPEEILPRQAGMQSLPSWSPDGHALALALNVDVSKDAHVDQGIYVVDWLTRKANKIPGSEGLTAPAWSPDGRTLIAKTFDEKKVLAFDFRTARWRTVVQGISLTHPSWFRDSRFLYVQDLLEAGEPVYRVDMETGKRAKVFSFETFLAEDAKRCVFDGFAPDGDFLASIQLSGTHIWEMELDLP